MTFHTFSQISNPSHVGTSLPNRQQKVFHFTMNAAFVTQPVLLNQEVVLDLSNLRTNTTSVSVGHLCDDFVVMIITRLERSSSLGAAAYTVKQLEDSVCN